MFRGDFVRDNGEFFLCRLSNFLKKKPWPEFPGMKTVKHQPPVLQFLCQIADTNYEEEYDDYHHNDEKTEGLVAGNNLPAGSSAPSPYHPRHQTSETSTIFSLSYTARSDIM